MSYTAVGEQVGLAQRMESAARLAESCSANPPHGWSTIGFLSKLTRELVQIKGAVAPAAARRLLATATLVPAREAASNVPTWSAVVRKLTTIGDLYLTGSVAGNGRMRR